MQWRPALPEPPVKTIRFPSGAAAIVDEESRSLRDNFQVYSEGTSSGTGL